MITLTVEKREETGAKAPALRREGKVPAVVYGGAQETTSITLNAREFEKVLRDAGESTVITLKGLDKDFPVLVHEIDLDPVKHAPRHVDFYAVTKGQEVEVAIPLEFVGESPAVKAGANLVKVMHELAVKADPMSLPHEIEVDVSVLAEINDQIHAKDLKLPAGVTLNVEPEEVVVLAQEVQEEEESAEAASIDDIEVEKKGKEEAEAPAEEKEGE